MGGEEACCQAPMFSSEVNLATLSLKKQYLFPHCYIQVNDATNCVLSIHTYCVDGTFPHSHITPLFYSLYLTHVSVSFHLIVIVTFDANFVPHIQECDMHGFMIGGVKIRGCCSY